MSSPSTIVPLLSPPASPNTKTIFLDNSRSPNPESSSSPTRAWSRSLSSNELSYFLPSRAAGANDMYLHHHLSTTKPNLLSQTRMQLLWAIMRVRHPLLASKVVRGPSGEVDDWSFSYTVPSTVQEALQEASQSLDSFIDLSGPEIISSYLNGPRQLSNNLLAKIIVSSHQSSTLKERKEITEFDFLLCTTHFVGDGMALHNFANQFWTLVGSEDQGVEELRQTLQNELMIGQESGINLIPLSAESRLSSPPKSNPNVYRAASKVVYESGKRKAIGGQILPRSTAGPSPVDTVVSTRYWTSDETRRVLKTCKENGISFTHAVFALVNLAWQRMGEKGIVTCDPLEPMMMYSALCMRSSLAPLPSTALYPLVQPSFFHLALGYFNIVLPSFPISSSAPASKTFFLRAKQTKAQILRAIKSKLLIGKALAEMEERRERAVGWARKDDEAEERTKIELESVSIKTIAPTTPPRRTNEIPLPTPPSSPDFKTFSFSRAQTAAASTPPSSPLKSITVPTSKPTLSTITNGPLIGLSILGNLDAIYNHASFGPISLDGLTTGSRQRSGASLLFGYIFQGRMVLSLGYDQPGFAPGVMEALWAELSRGVIEILLQ